MAGCSDGGLREEGETSGRVSGHEDGGRSGHAERTQDGQGVPTQARPDAEGPR